MALFAALALGALSALQARKQRKNAQKLQKARQDAYRRALSFLSPEALSQRIGQLTPLFRQDIASQFEPQMRQSTARALGTSGLAETGVGAMFENAARQAPRLAAFQSALSTGQQMGQEQANVALAQAGAPASPGSQSSVFDSLLQGIGTGSEFYSLFDQPKRYTTGGPEVPENLSTTSMWGRRS